MKQYFGFRFNFVSYYKPKTPEERLYCEILDTLFQDIDTLNYRRKKYNTNLKDISYYSGYMSIQKIKTIVFNNQIKYYCELLSFSHSKFITLFRKYLKYKLNEDLEP